MASTSAPTHACKYLVLDAGPLLSLSPLRGLAEIYVTVPQVLDELKDRRAREHFEQLGLSAGVKVEVRGPDSAALAKVVEAAKKTGDYAVLSHADLCVLALTYALDTSEKSNETLREQAQLSSTEPVPDEQPALSPAPVPEQATSADALDSLTQAVADLGVKDDDALLNHEDDQVREPLDVALERLPTEDHETIEDPALPESEATSDTLYDDTDDEDDGEGEWITPSNVAVHKSRALDLLPAASNSKKTAPVKQLGAACMTADFAMQNVILQMGLKLVGVEGKRIERVKTWVLRCHACFKICKDPSRKFCPSCGNATLLRASVTVGAPTTPGGQPTMQVHLKKNFQHRLRGTKYSIPAPKPGKAKTGTGDGLILREDQTGFARAAKMDASRREREERKMMSSALARGAKGEFSGVAIGSWMDPDWVPEILSVGAGGKGRSVKGQGDLPTIGYGRKNPNERRRKK